MTGQRFYPVFTMAKSLSSKAKRDSSDLQFKIQMLAFITEESNIPLLEKCGIAQTMLKKAAEANLGIEIIGV